MALRTCIDEYIPLPLQTQTFVLLIFIHPFRVIFQIYLPLKYFITWQRYTTTSTVWYLLHFRPIKGAFHNFCSTQITDETWQAAFLPPWAAQGFPKPRARTTIITVRDCSKVTPTKVLSKVLRLIHLKLSGERLRCRGEPTLERKTEVAVIITSERFAFATNLCSFCGEGKKARVTVK